MLSFRWTVAGGKNFPFEEEAVQEIYRIAKGVPRSIVKLANECLIRTAVEGRTTVNKDIVISAATEIAVDAS